MRTLDIEKKQVGRNGKEEAKDEEREEKWGWTRDGSGKHNRQVTCQPAETSSWEEEEGEERSRSGGVASPSQLAR